MKIYIVTSGDYSDYKIRAVFTDKEKAETFVATENAKHHYDERGIEEWDTNDDNIEAVPVVKGRFVYKSYGRDGVRGEQVCLTAPKDEHGRDHHEYFIRSDGNLSEAAEEERAKKIAGERHAQWLAEREGIA